MLKQCILSLSVFFKGVFCASRAYKVSVRASKCEWELQRCCWRLNAGGYSWTNTLGELCFVLYESEERDGGKSEQKQRSKKRKNCQKEAARSILLRLNLLFCEADLLPNAAPPKPTEPSSKYQFSFSLRGDFMISCFTWKAKLAH